MAEDKPTTEPTPINTRLANVVWCLDHSVDTLYMVTTAIEAHMKACDGGDDPLTRASVSTLLELVEKISETRKTLGSE